MSDLKSNIKIVEINDDPVFFNMECNAHSTYFIHYQRLLKVFMGMFLISISPLLMAETTAQSQLPENLFSPAKRVVCDAERGVCYDKFGPSIGLTQIYLGNEAAQGLTIIMREQVMLSGPGKVFFPTQESVCIGETGPCIVNGSVQEALTKIFFGPWHENEQNAQELALLNVEWQWVESKYNDDTSVKPFESSYYTVRFLTDGSVHARVDCNRAGGHYYLEAHQLRIDITHSTKAACEPNSMEALFLKDIARTGAFFLRQGKLYIDLNYHSGTMEFKH